MTTTELKQAIDEAEAARRMRQLMSAERSR